MNLRSTLILDAASAAIFVLLCLGFTPQLADMTGLSATIIAIAGWICIPSALLFLWQAFSPTRPLVTMVVAGNTAWVLASLAVWLAHFGVLSALGHAIIVMQALAVAFFAFMEWRGLKSLPTAATA